MQFKQLNLLSALLFATVLLYPHALVAEEPPLKIGAVLSLTGPAAGFGENARRAMVLAIEELNQRQTGLRTLQLVLEDGKSDPKSGVSAAIKLITVGKVDLIVGEVWDFLNNPLNLISKRYDILHLSPTVMPNSTFDQGEHFYTFGGNLASLAKVVDQTFKILAGKRFSLIEWEDNWGRGYTQVWSEAAKKNAVQFVTKVSTVDFASDFRAEILKITKGNPEVLLIAHPLPSILQRLKEWGKQITIITTDNLTDMLTLGLVDQRDLKDVYFTRWEMTPAFNEAFKKRWDAEPIDEAGRSYDLIHALWRASQIQKPLTEAIKEVKFEGVSGSIDFSRGMSVNYSESSLYHISNGQISRIP